VSAANVDVVRRALGTFRDTGQPDLELLDERIVTRDHDILDAGDYRGHEGHRRWIADWSAAWSQITIDPAVEVIDAGEDVVIVYRIAAVGRISGVRVEREDAMVCGVRDGRIANIDYYNSRSQALAQVGLQP
jgi:ketosteroid isomerase-like protein